ncbi:hypothetical protein ACFW3D_31630 [Streptomyces sp. NPDC058864]
MVCRGCPGALPAISETAVTAAARKPFALKVAVAACFAAPTARGCVLMPGK